MKINLWRGKNAIECKFPLLFYFYFYIHISNKITSHSKNTFIRTSSTPLLLFLFLFTFKTLIRYTAIGVNFKVDFIVEQQAKNLLVEQDR